MPVEKRSFLFRYFDKIVCAVIAIGLILVVVSAVKRNRGDETRNLIARIEQASGQVENQAHRAAPEEPVEDYLKLRAERNVVEAPGRVVDLTPHPAKKYEPVWLGTAQTEVLSFTEPLVPGTTVEVIGPAAEDVLKILEFPVDGDYTKVRVQTTKVEGRVELRAQTQRSRVVRAVWVKKGMNAQAYPPIELKALAIREGVALSFKPNPQNVEHVAVSVHQIWRQDPHDAAAGFTLLAEVPARPSETAWAGAGATAPVPSPGAPIPSPFGEGGWNMSGLPPAEGTGTGVSAEGANEPYKILDQGIQPDGVYVYKIRSMPQQYYQKPSEFTDKTQVETLPNIDFRYVRGQPLRGGRARLTFEVAKYTGNEIRTVSFQNRVGDMIGGVDYDETGRPVYYLTGCYLVDCHYYVRPEKGGTLGRITYMDRRGRLRMRYKNEVAAPDLWEQLQ